MSPVDYHRWWPHHIIWRRQQDCITALHLSHQLNVSNLLFSPSLLRASFFFFCVILTKSFV